MADNDSDDPKDDQPRHGERRKLTLKDYARRISADVGIYAVLVGAVLSICAAMGWGNPLVMAKDYKADQVVLGARLDGFDKRFEVIEGQLNALTTAVLESKEIQLKSEIRALELEISRAKPGSNFARLLAGQRDAVDQDLQKVQLELRRRRGDVP
jgi:hypothetical protein